MPFYEVYHRHPLSEAQQSQLAEAITDIHARLFATPKLFVHVIFTNTKTAGRPMFVAGKPRQSNLIMANVRTSASRTDAHWAELCGKLERAWQETVAAPGKYVEDESNKLRAIFILGTVLTAYEGGFMAPTAGTELAWFKEHLPAMQKNAADGDADLAEMLEEIKGRDEFKAVFANGH